MPQNDHRGRAGTTMARTPKAERGEEEEKQGLLSEPAASAPTPVDVESQQASKPSPEQPQSQSSSKGAEPPQPSKSQELGICRICLEEDVVSALESPCGCTGTQRHAHHACIQRWIDEKGNAKCEICEQPYQGSYTVPPAPAPVLENLPLFTPMYIVESSDGRGTHRGTLDLLDSDGPMQRNPSVSWCITFIVFFMFLVVLHHTLVVADGMDDDPNTGGGGTSAPPMQDQDESLASNLLLFLFWVATKAFLIGIPLYTVMRVASRQARREQYEAMMRAGAAFEPNRRMVIRVRNSQVPLATAV